MSLIFFVTEYQEGLLAGTMEDRHLTRASFFHGNQETILGNIYIAKVIDVVKNLNACFVDIAYGKKCFLPLDTCKRAILCNRKPDGRILEQDTIVVQVEKEAAKSKDPYVSGNLSLTGEYCVVLNDKAGISYSKKIPEKQKQRIKEAVDGFLQNEFPEAVSRYGIIIRTDVLSLGDDLTTLFYELKNNIQRMDEIYRFADKRTLYSVLYKRNEPYIEELKKWGASQFDRIVTDKPEVYAKLCEFMETNLPGFTARCSFYEDQKISLANLYNIPMQIKEALGRKVWLKCGGNLVIDELEAMTVVDVNTAKAVSMKSVEENFYKVNREACDELARQLILRNLSGMILIDFINLKSKEKEKEILHYLDSLLKQDSVTCRLVDMTPLGIVEVTRKRTYPSLKEQFGGYEKF